VALRSLAVSVSSRPTGKKPYFLLVDPLLPFVRIFLHFLLELILSILRGSSLSSLNGEFDFEN